MATEFGTQLRTLREKAGFASQSEFAQAAGVSKSLVNQYETGQLGSPKYSTAAKMARVLKVPVEELMSGTDAA